MITGLQEALPKSVGLLPFDGGVAGMTLMGRNVLIEFTSSLH